MKRFSSFLRGQSPTTPRQRTGCCCGVAPGVPGPWTAPSEAYQVTRAFGRKLFSLKNIPLKPLKDIKRILYVIRSVSLTEVLAAHIGFWIEAA